MVCVAHPLTRRYKSKEKSLKNWGKYLVVAIVFFFFGTLWGKLNFIQKEVRWLKNDVSVTAKSQSNNGVIPASTELHFHSSSHGTTKYFLFVELPNEEVKLKVSNKLVTHNAGIQPLQSRFSGN